MIFSLLLPWHSSSMYVERSRRRQACVLGCNNRVWEGLGFYIHLIRLYLPQFLLQFDSDALQMELGLIFLPPLLPSASLGEVWDLIGESIVEAHRWSVGLIAGSWRSVARYNSTPQYPASGVIESLRADLYSIYSNAYIPQLRIRAFVPFTLQQARQVEFTTDGSVDGCSRNWVF